MKVEELFNLGAAFMNEGRIETAMDIWNKVTAIDSNFGPVYLNQHNIFRNQGNLIKAKECLIRFLNCPVTGATIDSISSVRNQIAEIDKVLNPQAVVPPK